MKVTIDDRAFAARAGVFEPTIDLLWASADQLKHAADIAAELRTSLEPVRNGVEVINLRFCVRYEAEKARTGGDLRRWTPDDLELEIKAVIAWSNSDHEKVIVSERYRIDQTLLQVPAVITGFFLQAVRYSLNDRWVRMDSKAGHFHAFVEEFPVPPTR